MTIEIAVKQLLTTDPGTLAVLGAADRVFPAELPQTPVYPSILYQVVTGVSTYSMDGPSDLQSVRFQFDLFAEVADQLYALRNAVQRLLGGFKGDVDLPGSPTVTVPIQGSFKVMEFDGFEDGLAERAGPRVYRKTLDFIIWTTEAQNG